MADQSTLGSGGLFNALSGLAGKQNNNASSSGSTARGTHTGMSMYQNGTMSNNPAGMSTFGSGTRAIPTSSSSSKTGTGNFNTVANAINNNSKRIDTGMLKFMHGFSSSTAKLEQAINKQSKMLEKQTTAIITRLETINRSLVLINETLTKAFEPQLASHEYQSSSEAQMMTLMEMFMPTIVKTTATMSVNFYRGATMDTLITTILGALQNNNVLRRLFAYGRREWKANTASINYSKQDHNALANVIPKELENINKNMVLLGSKQLETEKDVKEQVKNLNKFPKEMTATLEDFIKIYVKGTNSLVNSNITNTNNSISMNDENRKNTEARHKNLMQFNEKMYQITAEFYKNSYTHYKNSKEFYEKSLEFLNNNLLNVGTNVSTNLDTKNSELKISLETKNDELKTSLENSNNIAKEYLTNISKNLYYLVRNFMIANYDAISSKTEEIRKQVKDDMREQKFIEAQKEKSRGIGTYSFKNWKDFIQQDSFPGKRIYFDDDLISAVQTNNYSKVDPKYVEYIKLDKKYEQDLLSLQRDILSGAKEIARKKTDQLRLNILVDYLNGKNSSNISPDQHLRNIISQNFSMGATYDGSRVGGGKDNTSSNSTATDILDYLKQARVYVSDHKNDILKKSREDFLKQVITNTEYFWSRLSKKNGEYRSVNNSTKNAAYLILKTAIDRAYDLKPPEPTKQDLADIADKAKQILDVKPTYDFENATDVIKNHIKLNEDSINFKTDVKMIDLYRGISNPESTIKLPQPNAGAVVQANQVVPAAAQAAQAGAIAVPGGTRITGSFEKIGNFTGTDKYDSDRISFSDDGKFTFKGIRDGSYYWNMLQRNIHNAKLGMMLGPDKKYGNLISMVSNAGVTLSDTSKLTKAYDISQSILKDVKTYLGDDIDTSEVKTLNDLLELLQGASKADKKSNLGKLRKSLIEDDQVLLPGLSYNNKRLGFDIKVDRKDKDAVKRAETFINGFKNSNIYDKLDDATKQRLNKILSSKNISYIRKIYAILYFYGKFKGGLSKKEISEHIKNGIMMDNLLHEDSMISSINNAYLSKNMKDFPSYHTTYYELEDTDTDVIDPNTHKAKLDKDGNPIKKKKWVKKRTSNGVLLRDPKTGELLKDESADKLENEAKKRSDDMKKTVKDVGKDFVDRLDKLLAKVDSSTSIIEKAVSLSAAVKTGLWTIFSPRNWLRLMPTIGKYYGLYKLFSYGIGKARDFRRAVTTNSTIGNAYSGMKSSFLGSDIGQWATELYNQGSTKFDEFKKWIGEKMDKYIGPGTYKNVSEKLGSIWNWIKNGFEALFGINATDRAKAREHFFQPIKDILIDVYTSYVLPAIGKLFRIYFGVTSLRYFGHNIAASFRGSEIFNVTDGENPRFINQNRGVKIRRGLSRLVNTGSLYDNGFRGNIYAKDDKGNYMFNNTWSKARRGIGRTGSFLGKAFTNGLRMFSSAYVLSLAFGGIRKLFSTYNTDPLSSKSVKDTVISFVGNIFSDIKNRLFGGYTGRQVLEAVVSSSIGLITGMFEIITDTFAKMDWKGLWFDLTQIISNTWNEMKNWAAGWWDVYVTKGDPNAKIDDDKVKQIKNITQTAMGTSGMFIHIKAITNKARNVINENPFYKHIYSVIEPKDQERMLQAIVLNDDARFLDIIRDISNKYKDKLGAKFYSIPEITKFNDKYNGNQTSYTINGRIVTPTDKDYADVANLFGYQDKFIKIGEDYYNIESALKLLKNNADFKSLKDNELLQVISAAIDPRYLPSTRQETHILTAIAKNTPIMSELKKIIKKDSFGVSELEVPGSTLVNYENIANDVASKFTSLGISGSLFEAALQEEIEDPGTDESVKNYLRFLMSYISGLTNEEFAKVRYNDIVAYLEKLPDTDERKMQFKKLQEAAYKVWKAETPEAKKKRQEEEEKKKQEEEKKKQEEEKKEESILEKIDRYASSITGFFTGTGVNDSLRVVGGTFRKVFGYIKDFFENDGLSKLFKGFASISGSLIGGLFGVESSDRFFSEFQRISQEHGLNRAAAFASRARVSLMESVQNIDAYMLQTKATVADIANTIKTSGVKVSDLNLSEEDKKRLEVWSNSHSVFKLYGYTEEDEKSLKTRIGLHTKEVGEALKEKTKYEAKITEYKTKLSPLAEAYTKAAETSKNSKLAMENASKALEVAKESKDETAIKNAKSAFEKAKKKFEEDQKKTDEAYNKKASIETEIGVTTSRLENWTHIHEERQKQLLELQKELEAYQNFVKLHKDPTKAQENMNVYLANRAKYKKSNNSIALPSDFIVGHDVTLMAFKDEKGNNLSRVRVTSKFGEKRTKPVYDPKTGKTVQKHYKHTGIDIVPSDKSHPPFKVLSFWKGVIEQVGTGTGGAGNRVWVRHTIGDKVFYAMYAHLKDFGDGITVGKEIARGQIIGTMGNSGHSKGAHLHFQVDKSNTSGKNPIDPMIFFDTIGDYLYNTEGALSTDEISRLVNFDVTEETFKTDNKTATGTPPSQPPVEKDKVNPEVKQKSGTATANPVKIPTPEIGSIIKAIGNENITYDGLQKASNLHNPITFKKINDFLKSNTDDDVRNFVTSNLIYGGIPEDGIDDFLEVAKSKDARIKYNTAIGSTSGTIDSAARIKYLKQSLAPTAGQAAETTVIQQTVNNGSESGGTSSPDEKKNTDATNANTKALEQLTKLLESNKLSATSNAVDMTSFTDWYNNSKNEQFRIAIPGKPNTYLVITKNSNGEISGTVEEAKNGQVNDVNKRTQQAAASAQDRLLELSRDLGI